MDFITIASALTKWAIAALIGCLGILVLVGGSYYFYKRVLHGKRRLSKKQGGLIMLLIGWLIIVLGLTTMSRGANFTGDINTHLFSGYVNAWNKWSFSELQLILFNMLMFVPLGLLLPLLNRRAQVFWITCLISLLTTAGIEVLQLLTGKGIFELDDILHNLVGSLAGYFIIMAILACARQRRFAIRAVLLAVMIPAFFAALIGGAMVAYHTQEYGNMPILSTTKQDMAAVTVENQLSLPEEEGMASLYRNVNAQHLQHGKEIAKLLSEKFDVNFAGFNRRDGDNNRIWTGHTADGQQAYLNYQIKDGGWDFSLGDEEAALTEQQVTKLRADMEHWFSKNGLLPDRGIFSIQNNSTLRWDAKEPEDIKYTQTDFVAGLIMTQFDKNGALSGLFYQMIGNKFVRQVEIISASDAFKQVLSGHFYMYSPFGKGDKLIVNGYKLTYVYDTKGYYQPVYEFQGYINDTEHVWSCQIPARK